ncbi:hypothetical protein AV530_017312 [Patagioenas fasciata monilis]|uniref:Uncharacterized protein n=1 Tax=Patagioenas fasciata monilis TaxID=372326 RepID=A0A1V4JFL1_PATFA|nr:hypothetical protein AV530_017312 [Patagioenas fasciata monilis]
MMVRRYLERSNKNLTYSFLYIQKKFYDKMVLQNGLELNPLPLASWILEGLKTTVRCLPAVTANTKVTDACGFTLKRTQEESINIDKSNQKKIWQKCIAVDVDMWSQSAKHKGLTN